MPEGFSLKSLTSKLGRRLSQTLVAGSGSPEPPPPPRPPAPSIFPRAGDNHVALSERTAGDVGQPTGGADESTKGSSLTGSGFGKRSALSLREQEHSAGKYRSYGTGGGSPIHA